MVEEPYKRRVGLEIIRARRISEGRVDLDDPTVDDTTAGEKKNYFYNRINASRCRTEKKRLGFP